MVDQKGSIIFTIFAIFFVLGGVVTVSFFLINGVKKNYSGSNQNKKDIVFDKSNSIKENQISSSQANIPSVIISPTVALIPGWKRYEDKEMGFAFQIPAQWTYFLCPNNQTSNNTSLLYANLEINVNHQYKCGDYGQSDIRISYSSKEKMDEFINNIRTQKPPRKIINSTITSKMIEVVKVYPNWCDGFEKYQYDGNCIPIAPAFNNIFIPYTPKNKSSNDQYLNISYRSDDNDLDVIIERLLNTFEFYN